MASSDLRFRRLPLLLALALVWLAPERVAQGQGISRSDVLLRARAFAELRWNATDANRLHGQAPDGIEVSTPDDSRFVAWAAGSSDAWSAGRENVGMPYKWGGFDTPESFLAGVRNGKAAGDLYSSEKRRLGGKAVSSYAVGIDCSGFISRCWNLSRKYGTSTLPEVCKPLRSASDLRPGDILNQAGGHVVLFAGWADAERCEAHFYEAAPFSKVVASRRPVSEYIEAGFIPLRYRAVRD